MSKQNEILATIETFLKDRNGENFQASLESDLRKDLQHIDELQYKYDETLVSNINNYDRFDKMVKVGR